MIAWIFITFVNIDLPIFFNIYEDITSAIDVDSKKWS